MCTSRATPALDDGAFEPPGPPDALSGTNRPPTDHQPTTNRAPTDHRPSTDRPKAPPQPAGPLAWFRSGKVRHSPSPHPGCAKGLARLRPQGPAPARWATGVVSVWQSPSQPVPSPRLREGRCPASARGPGRFRRFRETPWPLGPWPVSRRGPGPGRLGALAGFAKGPWPAPPQGPAPARWATGVLSVWQSPSQPVAPPRLRDARSPPPSPDARLRARAL